MVPGAIVTDRLASYAAGESHSDAAEAKSGFADGNTYRMGCPSEYAKTSALCHG
jgi:hypothetical protein